jgi:2-oxoglutarate ferredoxin oxidoreductase subunit beta
MPSIAKPIAKHPSLHRNELGLTVRDYEGSMSTLCAGCGHDSVTAAIIRACWELSIAPHMLAKMSGIGCSSKTPTYFVSGAHGFNSAHGLGHMCHAMRRNVKMLYVIENNGVYGLTKGQFSASADVGSKSKRGEPNRMQPIDPVTLGLSLGATFIARSFSGDKEQLVPIIKAALSHRGFAMVDVISPCVTFNDHVGSTKSYLYTRNNMLKINETDFVPPASEILATIGTNGAVNVAMHDGSVIRFKGVPQDYDPRDREKVFAYLQEHHGKGEVVTGLLYLDESVPDVHELNGTSDVALSKLPYEKLCPGSAALAELQEEYR